MEVEEIEAKHSMEHFVLGGGLWTRQFVVDTEGERERVIE